MSDPTCCGSTFVVLGCCPKCGRDHWKDLEARNDFLENLIPTADKRVEHFIAKAEAAEARVKVLTSTVELAHQMLSEEGDADLAADFLVPRLAEAIQAVAREEDK